MNSNVIQYRQPENLGEMELVAKNDGNVTNLPHDYFNLTKHKFNSSPVEIFNGLALELLSKTPMPIEIARNQAVKDQQYRARIEI